MFEQAKSANSLCMVFIVMGGFPFLYVCLCDVVVVNKMGAYVYGVLIIPILWYVYILMWPVWMFVVGKYPVSHLKPALKAFMTKHRLIVHRSLTEFERAINRAAGRWIC